MPSHPRARIVTITGNIGVGKTSVARAVPEAVSAAGELINFVDASPTDDILLPSLADRS